MWLKWYSYRMNMLLKREKMKNQLLLETIAKHLRLYQKTLCPNPTPSNLVSADSIQYIQVLFKQQLKHRSDT